MNIAGDARRNLRGLAPYRISLRGALWCTALVAICLGVLRIRAEIQQQYVRLLESRGCEVAYSPVADWIAYPAAFADPSDSLFQMTHNVTSVKVSCNDEVDHVVSILKTLPTVRELELCLGGSCGLSWISAHQTADRVRRELPQVQIKVTAPAIWLVG